MKTKEQTTEYLSTETFRSELDLQVACSLSQLLFGDLEGDVRWVFCPDRGITAFNFIDWLYDLDAVVNHLRWQVNLLDVYLAKEKAHLDSSTRSMDNIIAGIKSLEADARKRITVNSQANEDKRRVFKF